MIDKIKIYLPVTLVFLCVIYFGDCVAEAAGGYLEGYEDVDPRPTAVSWWSTLAYMLSLFYRRTFQRGATVGFGRQSSGKFTIGTKSLCLHR